MFGRWVSTNTDSSNEFNLKTDKTFKYFSNQSKDTIYGIWDTTKQVIHLIGLQKVNGLINNTGDNLVNFSRKFLFDDGFFYSYPRKIGDINYYFQPSIKK